MTALGYNYTLDPSSETQRHCFDEEAYQDRVIKPLAQIAALEAELSAWRNGNPSQASAQGTKNAGVSSTVWLLLALGVGFGVFVGRNHR